MSFQIDSLLTMLELGIIEKDDLPGIVAGGVVVLSFVSGPSTVAIAGALLESAEEEAWDDLIPQLEEFWSFSQ